MTEKSNPVKRCVDGVEVRVLSPRLSSTEQKPSHPASRRSELQIVLPCVYVTAPRHFIRSAPKNNLHTLNGPVCPFTLCDASKRETEMSPSSLWQEDNWLSVTISPPEKQVLFRSRKVLRHAGCRASIKPPVGLESQLSIKTSGSSPVCHLFITSSINQLNPNWSETGTWTNICVMRTTWNDRKHLWQTSIWFWILTF